MGIGVACDVGTGVGAGVRVGMVQDIVTMTVTIIMKEKINFLPHFCPPLLGYYQIKRTPATAIS